MSTQSHAELFVRAVEAVVGAGPSDPGTLFTDDVHSWSPVLNVSSLAELSDAIHDRDESLSNVTVAVRALHTGGNRVPLGMVGVEEALRRGPFDDLGQFPSQVHRILHPEAEALPTGWVMHVRRVAGE